jgi:putative transposase
MYHIVCPSKYRRTVFSAIVDVKLKEICDEIQKRYEITFLEIGSDSDHVHFLVQSVPMYSPKQIVQIIKSITAREIFKACPEVKQYLWGGKFWSEGYFVSTVGAHGNEQMIKNYVQQQGQVEFKTQLNLF